MPRELSVVAVRFRFQVSRFKLSQRETSNVELETGNTDSADDFSTLGDFDSRSLTEHIKQVLNLLVYLSRLRDDEQAVVSINCAGTANIVPTVGLNRPDDQLDDLLRPLFELGLRPSCYAHHACRTRHPPAASWSSWKHSTAKTGVATNRSRNTSRWFTCRGSSNCGDYFRHVGRRHRQQIAAVIDAGQERALGVFRRGNYDHIVSIDVRQLEFFEHEIEQRAHSDVLESLRHRNVFGNTGLFELLFGNIKLNVCLLGDSVERCPKRNSLKVDLHSLIELILQRLTFFRVKQL